jgi:hypothetical protein
VTSWRIQAGPTTTGNARLRIFRPLAPDLFQLVAQSNEESVTLGAERSFTTSVPVQGGDVLGLRTGAINGDIASVAAAGVTDQAWGAIGDPAIGQTVGTGGDFTYGTNQALTNIGATLFKPDPDSSPPETTIASGPGKRVGKGKAKFRFESSEAGSTFVCKRDRKPFRPCTSPLRYGVRAGKHKLTVQAVDPVGNADPTPAKKKFTVPG